MAKYIGKRLLHLVWIMIAISFLTFLLMYLAPGDAATKKLNAQGVAVKTNLTDAHSYPLQILYCQGLPALLSWLGAVGFTLSHWVKYRRDRAAAILGGGLACFLCAMLFCLSSVIIMPFFWLALGLLDAAAAKAQN